MSKSKTFRVSKPGSMLFKFFSVRTSRPAPARTRTDSATCTITRLPLRFNHRPRDAPLASAAGLSLSAGVKSRRIPRTAGARPNKIPVRTEAAAVNTRTRRSKCTAKCDGHSPPRDIKATSDCTLQYARSIPNTPPAAERSTLSVSNCLAILERPAPRASRTASSLCRVAERASISPATLVHATNKTIPTAVIRIVSGVEKRSRSPLMPCGAGIRTRRGASSALNNSFVLSRTSL